jgi:hypothetical protein
MNTTYIEKLQKEIAEKFERARVPEAKPKAGLRRKTRQMEMLGPASASSSAPR